VLAPKAARTQWLRISWRNWTPATSPRSQCPTISSARPPVRSCRRENARPAVKCGEFFFFLFHGNQQTSEFLRSGLVLSDIASTFCFFDLWVKFKEKKYRWKNHPFDWCFVDVRCLEPPAREAEFALHWMVCIFDLISPDGSRSRTPCAIWKSCGRGVLRVWEVGCWTGTPRKINDDERLCHLGAPLYYWSKL
jgi:hypothetical protein